MLVIDRILFVLAGLCLLALGGVALGSSLNILPIETYKAVLDQIWTATNNKPEAMALVVIFAILAIRLFILACVIKVKSKNIIVQDTEYGCVTVSFVAIEHLILRVVKRFNQIRDVKITFKTTKAGLEIYLKLIVLPNCNMLEMTSSLQKSISSSMKDVLGIEPLKVEIALDKMQLETKRVE